jgi:hypothetical protein
LIPGPGARDVDRFGDRGRSGRGDADMGEVGRCGRYLIAMPLLDSLTDVPPFFVTRAARTPAGCGSCAPPSASRRRRAISLIVCLNAASDVVRSGLGFGCLVRSSAVLVLLLPRNGHRKNVEARHSAVEAARPSLLSSDRPSSRAPRGVSIAESASPRRSASAAMMRVPCGRRREDNFGDERRFV